MHKIQCACAVAACRNRSGHDWRRVRSAILCSAGARCSADGGCRAPIGSRPCASHSSCQRCGTYGVLAMTFKIFLLFAGLMVKVPVGLYFSCKLLLFQSLMLMSPEDSAFYPTIVSVVELHVVLAIFVFNSMEGRFATVAGKQK